MAKPLTNAMPETVCPNCGKAVDAATGIGHRRKPKPDDITVCLYCGHIMAFADDLSLRDLTDAEMHEIAGDPKILEIQKARGEVMQEYDNAHQGQARRRPPRNRS